MKGERIACLDLKRLRIPLVLGMLVSLVIVVAGCGSEDPDPGDVLDRALTRQNLSGFGNGPEGPTAGVVSVQALGFEDRILDERRVAADPQVMSEIRQALGADSGLRGMVEDLEFEGTEELAGAETSHISGSIEVAGLADALERAGGSEVGSLAGVDREAALEDSLVAADFDLFAGAEDGTIRRLDLTLAFDDPDNALPPTRIRFSLTPVSSTQSDQ